MRIQEPKELSSQIRLPSSAELFVLVCTRSKQLSSCKISCTLHADWGAMVQWSGFRVAASCRRMQRTDSSCGCKTSGTAAVNREHKTATLAGKGRPAELTSTDASVY